MISGSKFTKCQLTVFTAFDFSLLDVQTLALSVLLITLEYVNADSPLSKPTPSMVPSPSRNEVQVKAKKNPKGRKSREPKEAEGTQALERFEQPERKSVYKLNGEPLEVDPD